MSWERVSASFSRALAGGDLARIEAAAVELPQVTALDALAISVAARAPDWPRVIQSWLSWWVSEEADLRPGLAVLGDLPENRGPALRHIALACQRQQRARPEPRR